MIFEIEFQENDVAIDTSFGASDVSIGVSFGVISHIPEIPSNYGLVTYDSNKILTVS